MTVVPDSFQSEQEDLKFEVDEQELEQVVLLSLQEASCKLAFAGGD